jgi:hypothetical protein
MRRLLSVLLAAALIMVMAGTAFAGIGNTATWSRSRTALTMTSTGPTLARVWAIQLTGTGSKSNYRIRITAETGDVGMTYTVDQLKIVSGREQLVSACSFYQTIDAVAPTNPCVDSDLGLNINLATGLSVRNNTLSAVLTGPGFRNAFTYSGAVRVARAPFIYGPWIWTGTGSIGSR